MDNAKKVDLHNFKVYVTVKEAGSMSAAAKLLGMSQSGVSQSIQALELALGTQLFDRGIRPLMPTPAGAILYEHVCGIMTEVDRTFELVRGGAMLPQPQLKIGIIDSFIGAVGPYLFTHIGKIARHYRVWSGLSAELECELFGRQIDMLIASDGADVMLNSMISFELMTEPYVLAIPGSWKETGSDLLRLAREKKFIQYSLRSVFGKHIQQHLRRIKLSPSSSYEFDASDSVLGLVGAGLGWAITTPLCCLQARGRLQNVRILPLPVPGISRSIYLFVRDEAFRQIGQSIAYISQMGIQKNCIPEIAAFAPWTVPKIIVETIDAPTA